MSNLNIGCGLKAPEDWINIDASPSLRISRIYLVRLLLGKRLPPWPRNVRYADITRRLNIDDNSCDLVFASHVIEHLSLDDAIIAFANIYAVIKPNGILRLIVPDLLTITRNYIDMVTINKDPDAAFQCTDALGVGCRIHKNSFLARLKEAFSNSRHQWLWDELSMKQALETVGFRNITKRSYGDWADKRFAQVEEPERHHNSICLEASK